MNVRNWRLPWRVGTTSYIVADDLAANALTTAFRTCNSSSTSQGPGRAICWYGCGCGGGHRRTQRLDLHRPSIDDLGEEDAPPTPEPIHHCSHAGIRPQSDHFARALTPWAWVCHLDKAQCASGDFSPRPAWRRRAPRRQGLHRRRAGPDITCVLSIASRCSPPRDHCPAGRQRRAHSVGVDIR
jgi:hypothetical protein